MPSASRAKDAERAFSSHQDLQSGNCSYSIRATCSTFRWVGQTVRRARRCQRCESRCRGPASLQTRIILIPLERDQLYNEGHANTSFQHPARPEEPLLRRRRSTQRTSPRSASSAKKRASLLSVRDHDVGGTGRRQRWIPLRAYVLRTRPAGSGRSATSVSASDMSGRYDRAKGRARQLFGAAGQWPG